MAEGYRFYIQVVNATFWDLNLSGSPPSVGLAWDPPDIIAANSSATFLAQWEDPGYSIQTGGTATYTFTTDGPGVNFEIVVSKAPMKGMLTRHPAEVGYGVGVNCGFISISDSVARSIRGYDLYYFPPPDTNNWAAAGWLRDGVVTVGVFGGTRFVDPGIQPRVPAYPVPNAQDGRWPDDLTALRPSVKNWSANWMSQYAPCIELLTLPELTLPGTHNAGTYRARLPTQQTQYRNIDEQLCAGVRALDLRWIPTLDNTFWVAHSGETGVSLTSVLDQVNEFLDSNPQEIIVLDMHRFESALWSTTLLSLFADTIESCLGSRLIPMTPPPERKWRLDEIWQTEGRVVIGMGDFSSGLKPEEKAWVRQNTSFWTNAVRQYWADGWGKWRDVARYIDQVLYEVASPRESLWALQAEFNEDIPWGIDYPAYVPAEISSYFAYGAAALQANIIYADWWDRINSNPEQNAAAADGDLGPAAAGVTNGVLPSSTTTQEKNAYLPNFAPLTIAVGANLLKGYRKACGLRLWDAPRKLELEWRWCNNCGGQWYAGVPNQTYPCPFGGSHVDIGSMDYGISYQDLPDIEAVGDWRWCGRCSGLILRGDPKPCPAGGSHALNDAKAYDLTLGIPGDVPPGRPYYQGNWRYCAKCFGLVFGGQSPKSCPAGDCHVFSDIAYALLVAADAASR